MHNISHISIFLNPKTFPIHLFLVVFLFLGADSLFAQTKPTDESDKKNLTIYTGVSPIVLQQGDNELNVTTSLNSFWIATNEYNNNLNATHINNRYRYSRADHSIRFSHGFSKTGRWDLGLQLNFARTLLNDAARSSPFLVYGGGSETTGETNSGLASVGLQVRMTPLPDKQNFTLQAGYTYPLAKSELLRAQLGSQRTYYNLSANYISRLGVTTLSFLTLDFRHFLANEENNSHLFLPSLSAYLAFELPNDKWYVFPGIVYAPSFRKAKGGSLLKSGEQIYGSIGALYRVRRDGKLSLFLSTQTPFVLESGTTNSIFVRNSYFGFNLGARYLM